MEEKTIRNYITDIVNNMVKASISGECPQPSWWLQQSQRLLPLIQKANERMVNLNQEIAKLKVDILDRAKENKEKVTMSEIDVRIEATDVFAEKEHLKHIINWSFEQVRLAKKMAGINADEMSINQY